MYTLDTNVLIYLLNGNRKLEEFFNRYRKSRFFISVITRFELLVGAERQNMTLSELENYLDLFENVNVDKKIIEEAVRFALKFRSALRFKDLLIAATASFTKSILVTADKDFKRVPGLRVEMVRF